MVIMCFECLQLFRSIYLMNNLIVLGFLLRYFRMYGDCVRRHGRTRMKSYFLLLIFVAIFLFFFLSSKMIWIIWVKRLLVFLSSYRYKLFICFFDILFSNEKMSMVFSFLSFLIVFVRKFRAPSFFRLW